MEFVDPDLPLRDWTEGEDIVTFWHGDRQYAARRDQPVLTPLPDIRDDLLSLVADRFPEFTEERRDWGQVGWVSVWKTPHGPVSIDQAEGGGVTVALGGHARRYASAQGLIQALRAFKAAPPATDAGNVPAFTGHTLEWHTAGEDSRLLNEHDLQELPTRLQQLLLASPDPAWDRVPMGRAGTVGPPVVLDRMFTLHARLGDHHFLAQAPTLLGLRPYAEVLALLAL
ncbi:hypothetical protein [Deinococcus ficus]|uniref:Uncharacterized protein n=1 Tax=Deinococcus ficus TaxID=317577 RepID=A0A221T2T5_9DEIO|nr:hypothetical protein [Deinococcus ficus]ASN83170.1 hypothetical protein DFI_18390 [Deinococcus ficus]